MGKVLEGYYKETEYLLYNYKMFEISIKNMQQEIQFLRDEDGSRGITYDSIPTSPTNKFSSSTEDIALSVSEKIDYLEHSIRRMQGKIESIDKSLAGLTDIEKIIITEKYIEGLQWWQVASAARYSERHCKRVRSQAINKLVVGLYGIR